jgi:hypothetical protein
MKLLGLIRIITFSFSTSDSLVMLYFALVRSELYYASVAWNSRMITDSNKENVRPFATMNVFELCNIAIIIYLEKITFSDTTYNASSV